MTPLVLLSGMNCTADLWTECGLDDALTPALDQQSVDSQVDRLLAVLPPRFVLGGLSLGAIVAMALATRAPSRIEALCLVSTNAKAPTPAQRASWRTWTDRLDAGETPRHLQHDILPALLTPAAIADRPDLVERTLAMGDATGAAVLRAQLAMQATRVDLRPALSEMAPVPTLIVSGLQDAICPPEFHTEIAAALPHARLVTIDSGHLLPLEAPEEFGALIAALRG